MTRTRIQLLLLLAIASCSLATSCIVQSRIVTSPSPSVPFPEGRAAAIASLDSVARARGLKPASSHEPCTIRRKNVASKRTDDLPGTVAASWSAPTWSLRTLDVYLCVADEPTALMEIKTIETGLVGPLFVGAKGKQLRGAMADLLRARFGADAVVLDPE